MGNQFVGSRVERFDMIVGIEEKTLVAAHEQQLPLRIGEDADDARGLADVDALQLLEFITHEHKDTSRPDGIESVIDHRRVADAERAVDLRLAIVDVEGIVALVVDVMPDLMDVPDVQLPCPFDAFRQSMVDKLSFGITRKKTELS